MEKIRTRGHIVEIPANVEELTPKQYEYYCFLAFALMAKAITPEYFRIRWFSYLIGLRKADYTILKAEYVEELEKQSAVIDNFLTGSEGNIQLDLDTAKNLLPECRGYKGPGDMCQGVTFGEFIECYTVIESLVDASVDELEEGYRHIARTLYHIPETEPVPEILIFHAPKFFGNVWNAIQRGPIEINGKKIDFRIIFRSSGPSRPDDKTGWTGITFEIASAGLFGNVEQVKNTDMWAVLLYLYKCKFEYNNEKRNSKSS